MATVMAALYQPWADAEVIQSALYQPWADAAAVRATLVQPWADALAARATMVQPWSVTAAATSALDQPWSILGDSARSALEQSWDLRDTTPVRATLVQPWSLAADGSVLRYTLTVLADGHPVGVSSLTIEGDWSEDSIYGELHPGAEADWLRCPEGAVLDITVTSQEGSDQFSLVVTTARISEQHGETSYIVEASSSAALLGDPWSVPIDGELTGMASTIATELVARASGSASPPLLQWQTVDWLISADVWTASQQTPLELLRTLAAAVGAVVQSAADGSVRILPEYPLSVPQWGTAEPDRTLIEILDCFSVGAQSDPHPGYNIFWVGDQASDSTAREWLETSDLSSSLKEARGYQVPWSGSMGLTHSGGTWVSITAQGIEERTETETVELVGGSGSARYPIINLQSVTWMQADLGTLTGAEDGTLASAVAGQSLAAITYTTRCLLWQVRDLRSEQLQLVAET